MKVTTKLNGISQTLLAPNNQRGLAWAGRIGQTPNALTRRWNFDMSKILIFKANLVILPALDIIPKKQISKSEIPQWMCRTLIQLNTSLEWHKASGCRTLISITKIGVTRRRLSSKEIACRNANSALLNSSSQVRQAQIAPRQQLMGQDTSSSAEQIKLHDSESNS